VNGKVERNHKTDSEEFYQRRHFKHKRDLARKLKRREANTTRIDLTSPSRERLLRTVSAS
jgi:hypothetical protein